MANSKKLLAGVSGYSFKEWKGSFYPESITNTFYQMPKVAVLENWARSTPEAFRFAIKASRHITHMTRIKAESAAAPAYAQTLM